MTLDSGGALVRVRLNAAPDGAIRAAKAGLHAAALRAHPSADAACAATEELLAYLAGCCKRFHMSWRLPEGISPFRRRVLTTVAAIPFGETLSYGQVADLAGRPGAARAVGGAMAANPLPLVIPCHRVLASGGRLGGFSGGLSCKQALLEHEGWRVWDP